MTLHLDSGPKSCHGLYCIPCDGGDWPNGIRYLAAASHILLRNAQKPKNCECRAHLPGCPLE